MLCNGAKSEKNFIRRIGGSKCLIDHSTYHLYPLKLSFWCDQYHLFLILRFLEKNKCHTKSSCIVGKYLK